MSTSKKFRLDDARNRTARQFTHVPDADESERLKAEFGLLGLKKAEMSVSVEPKGRGDWVLTGHIGATVVQPCVVTLKPVTTRIDAKVERIWMVEPPEPKGSDEVEMPEDDRIEARPAVLDLAALFAEALALELPEWPRAEGAALPEDVQQHQDERPNPFAALADLKARMDKT
jgi:uncharacterized metal-binding protein YceD (DUF177 family)